MAKHKKPNPQKATKSTKEGIEAASIPDLLPPSTVEFLESFTKKPIGSFRIPLATEIPFIDMATRVEFMHQRLSAKELAKKFEEKRKMDLSMTCPPNDEYLITLKKTIESDKADVSDFYPDHIRLSNVSSYSIPTNVQIKFFEEIVADVPLDTSMFSPLDLFQKGFYKYHKVSTKDVDLRTLVAHWRFNFAIGYGDLFYSLFTNMVTYMVNNGWTSYDILKKVTSLLTLAPNMAAKYDPLRLDAKDFGLNIFEKKLKNPKEVSLDDLNPGKTQCLLLTLIDLVPILHKDHGVKLLCYYPNYSLILAHQDRPYNKMTKYTLKRLGIPKQEIFFKTIDDDMQNQLYVDTANLKMLPESLRIPAVKEVEKNNDNKVIATIGGKKITQKTLDSRAMTLKNTYKELSKEEREKLLNITREDVFKVFSRSEIKGQISSSEMSGFHAFAKKATEKIGDNYNVDACDCCSGGKHFDYEVNGRKIYEALFKSEKMKDEDLTDAEFNLRILNDETFIMKKQKTEENKRKGIIEEKNDDSSLPSYNSSAKSSILSDIFINSYTNEDNNTDEDTTKVESEQISNVIQNIPTFSSSSPPVFKEDQFKKLDATVKVTNWLSENILIKNFLKKTFRFLPMVEIAETILNSSLYESDENNSKLFYNVAGLNTILDVTYIDQYGKHCLFATRPNSKLSLDKKDNFKHVKKQQLDNDFSADVFYESLKNNISLEKFDHMMDKTFDEDANVEEVESITNESEVVETNENIGYINLKKISEIVWADNSGTIKQPNEFLVSQNVMLSAKNNTVDIDFSSFDKHLDEFNDLLKEENKEEYDVEIVELEEPTINEDDSKDLMFMEKLINFTNNALFQEKVVSIDYDSYMDDLIDDDLMELVIPEDEKTLPTISLTSPFKETPSSSMLRDMFTSKGIDESVNFEVKGGFIHQMAVNVIKFTNPFMGKRMFLQTRYSPNGGSLPSKQLTNAGLISEEKFTMMCKDLPASFNRQVGTLHSEFLYSFDDNKLEMARNRSYENVDFLDSDDESDELTKAYDEYETKEKIFNNCITMIRSAVKIALREKLEHATKEIEVEKNRLLLLKQLEEEESQSKTKKAKKKEKNKKKQLQKEEKEAKKLEEQKKKNEELKLKKEREEKEMKRREEQRKKAEELKKKKDEQLKKKREEQARRDEIEAQARKQKEEQKRLKEEQRKLKEEEKKKKQLEKKRKQELKEKEMREAEEEMKRKLELDTASAITAQQVATESILETSQPASEKGDRKKSLLSTQNVQPYMSLLDSLQSNNHESTTANLLNLTSNVSEKVDDTMSYNSSYLMNQAPPGLSMTNDFRTPSPMMNPQGMMTSSTYGNATNITPGSNSMLYNQTSPIASNPLGSMYGSVYQQPYSNDVSGYGMYTNGMMQQTMMTNPNSTGTMMNEEEGMNHMSYTQLPQSVWNNNTPQQGPFSSTMMSLAGGGFLNNNMNSYYSSLMGVYGNSNKKPADQQQQPPQHS